MCVCVCAQCQLDIDHIHRSRTVSGILPAALTSIRVALILLTMLFFLDMWTRVPVSKQRNAVSGIFLSPLTCT